ncbi:fimbrial protein [Uliginosibacterium sp. sgz301328]|uniref:fimbrial protein n=1 Tax=Uliginosibacterium sp. sgz301328 TaxID=3243764 RepID=UPI00359CEE42
MSTRFWAAAIVWTTVALCLKTQVAHAGCLYQASTSTNNWSLAQNQPIGPSSLTIYPLRFQPAGTVLFDRTYDMSELLAADPEVVLYKCQNANDAATSFAALRLDDTYQYGGFTANGTQYYFMQYVYPAQAPATHHTTTGWALFGVNPDGTERAMIWRDDTSLSNTAVQFSVSGYEASTLSDKATYPYVVKVKHFPRVRLVFARAPYDENKFAVVSDGLIGRIGYGAYAGLYSTDATYGYIKFGNYQPTATAACGVSDVPRTVNLGTHAKATIVEDGGGDWVSFPVQYECSGTNSPIGSLRVGFEPQNRNRLVSGDPRFLLSDDSGTNATGVAIVHRRSGETSNRNWVQNSGCNGVSTSTENHSNCPLASGQGQADGWYPVQPVSSGTSDGLNYYGENFEARIEHLTGQSVTPGTVRATVNVLVNQP